MVVAAMAKEVRNATSAMWNRDFKGVLSFVLGYSDAGVGFRLRPSLRPCCRTWTRPVEANSREIPGPFQTGAAGRTVASAGEKRLEIE
jgi:hypothetical protein